ncbi:CIC11C00000004707 [Sungouiella intermedia]|uniref:CIC11C00000004707 n=1 Tax=Sungouiella intermedia TaxID=45354 RepID=A0A1L0B7S9_9ASCO|nr:CIC11C00000004707 [[Candida] intermedia]
MDPAISIKQEAPSLIHEPAAPSAPPAPPAPTEVAENVIQPLSAAPVAEEPKENHQTRLKAKSEQLTALQLKQKAANVVLHLRLKPTLFQSDLIDLEPSATLLYTVKEQNFYVYDDLPLNRRGYKYKPCRANGQFTSNLYLTGDYAPYTVRADYFDRSPGVACSEDMSAVTTQHGWLSARSNIGIREGKHYFEFDIVNANNESDKSHVRVGIARKEAALEAPVGFDGYGYGLRDLTGQKITLSRPKPFMPESMNGFSSGDTIGMLVELPPLEVQRAQCAEFAREFQNSRKKKRRGGHLAADDEERKLNLYSNVVRDQVPIKYKNGLYFEQFEYTTTKQMDHLLNPVTVFGERAVLEKNNDTKPAIPTIPNSKITVYKNGVCVGTMFEDLYLFLPLNANEDASAADANTKQLLNPSYRNTDDGSLGYYPMMSVYLSGIVKLNAGPAFKYDIPSGALPLSENYAVKIAEDVYWDILDEVEAQYLDSFE